MIISEFEYQKNTFFDSISYGKAVIFDPNSKHKYLLKKQTNNLINQIQSDILEYFNTVYKVNWEQLTSLYSDSSIEAVQSLFWEPYFNNIMVNIRKKNKISFLELYDMCIVKAKERFSGDVFKSYISQEAFNQAEKILLDHDANIKTLIKRRLFQFLISRYKKPIIVIIDEFHEEYFYQLSEVVKGIIIRKVDDYNLIVDYAYNFQIPMVKTDIEIKKHDFVIIDNIKEEVFINPDKKTFQLYKHTCDNIIFSKNEIAKYQMKQLKLYIPLVDTRYLNILENESFYAGVGIFKTEYFFMTRGLLPSNDELTNIFVQLMNTFKNREINVSIPDFGENKRLNYYLETATSIINIHGYTMVFNIFFDSLFEAILKTNKKIALVIPMMRNGDDITLWKEKINYLFKKLPKELMPYIVGFLQTDNSIDQIEDFVKSDFNILDLDTYI
ncbi:MAG: putative PEP-binding protein, partial [Acholeplasmataceae bacterium]